MSPVKYELGFYIPEDDILHSHRCETPQSYSRNSSSQNLVMYRIHPFAEEPHSECTTRDRVCADLPVAVVAISGL
jgi:hypothetical protein